MEQEQSFRDAQAQYEGEDTSLTRVKELAAWYSYSFAAEVFILCGVGSFIPIILEQVARENGVLLSDKTLPCTSNFSHRMSQVKFQSSVSLEPCVIFLLGVQINTASFAMYTFSVSVLFQALVVISISCAADNGNYRKRLLLIFAYGGALTTMLFLFLGPKTYLLAAFLTIISNTCCGASFVLLNSFLPLLARHHPKAQYKIQCPDLEPDVGVMYSTPNVSVNTENSREPSIRTPLLAHPNGDSSLNRGEISTELQLSTQISSKGIGAGYCAGLIVECISIFTIWEMGSTTFSIQIALFLVGLWWAIFSIPAIHGFCSRPGPPLIMTKRADFSKIKSSIAYIGYAWLSLWRTIKQAHRLKDATIFLIAWFLISDSIATVSGTAILYAKVTLNMTPEKLGMINIVTIMAGILGALSWPLISRVLSLKPSGVILACIFAFEMIPLYGLLGYLPIVKYWGVLGLQRPWEMYPLGFIYGFILGGLSSYCRSMYGELVPPGSEAAFYSLYAITDKGSSIFGPAIVGAIIDRYGDIRPAFFFLALLISIPAPLIWYIDMERGKRECHELAKVLKRHKSSYAHQNIQSRL
ncbi:BgTH12-06040 [Blumeria graminis f. sp. triticale]|uniref:Autophagy-related protein n=3 Tax=Blumeria graminis TaxID=34373 RepID=A0A381LDD8_BLUGR|nr:Vacuolar integral membrane protein [Blumeria graminis f. sp. tritici 96224]CAD6504309.1 BgTH12-06040 [Blumeria graminis f. sp. triticale]VDB91121.1 Bgt-582 [Blumeria graminis f. sp. tritici]